jgi:hypothetical protein
VKSPLDRDVLIANSVAVATGVQAHRTGASPMESVNVGLWWRYWYKNLTMGLILLAVTIIMALNRPWAWWLVAAQVVLNVLVTGITYVSMVRVSYFKQRALYRLFRPVWRLVPNVARFWWYLCLFLPVWFFMWIYAVAS